MSVDAGGVQAASGKAEDSADTSVVSVGFCNAALRGEALVDRWLREHGQEKP